MQTAQNLAALYSSQQADVDNLTRVTINVAALMGRTWAPTKAADVSVLGVEGLMTLWAWMGSVIKTYMERSARGELGQRRDEAERVADAIWATQDAAPQHLQNPDFTPSRQPPVTQLVIPGGHGDRSPYPSRGQLGDHQVVTHPNHMVTTSSPPIAKLAVGGEGYMSQLGVTTSAPEMVTTTDHFVRLLVARGGTLVASQRMLGHMLNCSKTAVANTLAALSEAGVCSVATTAKGTVIQLLKPA